MKKEKLKDCPFCGREDELLGMLTRKGLIRAQCRRCGALGPIRFGEDNATEAWNTRVSRSPSVSVDEDGRAYMFGESAVL